MSVNEAIREVALQDVLAERAAQDDQWGGPDHDDKHLDADWLFFIERQITLMTWKSGIIRNVTSEYRSRLVKIAALALAAVESHDRKRIVRGLKEPTRA